MKQLNYFKKLISLEQEITRDDNRLPVTNFLIRKGDHFFEMVIYLLILVSVSFSTLNIIFWDNTELVITLIPLPFVIISLILFKRGYRLLAKSVFIGHLLIVITMLVMHNGLRTGVVIFFIPAFITTMMIFQGNERKTGYIIVSVSFFVLLAIFENNLHFGFRELTPQQVHREFIINMTGASLLTFLEVFMIIEISNRIQFRLMDQTRSVRSKNTELEKANAELDSFVYSVSHDLRSPLLSVKGLLSLVFESAKLEPETDRYLKMADKSIARLDHTLQEILDYSRNARLEVGIQPVSLSGMVQEIYADLKINAPASLRLLTDIKGSGIIHTDAARLETVMRNLIGNAIKYSRPDATDAYVRVTLIEKEGQPCITVEDNGEGIDPEDLPRVFEMFYRGTATSVGSGLGLYICREVLSKLNGTIAIESELHKGTLVTILLPKGN